MLSAPLLVMDAAVRGPLKTPEDICRLVPVIAPPALMAPANLPSPDTDRSDDVVMVAALREVVTTTELAVTPPSALKEPAASVLTTVALAAET